MSDYVRQHAVRSTFSEGKSWVVLSEIEQSIKRKIEAVGVPLKDWDIKINRGILTGCNEAFIIDGATRDRLIAEDPKSAEIIRPILRGRDIKRYRHSFADKWLIATFPAKHLEINDYPAVRGYLSGFQPKLEQTGAPLSPSEREQIKTHALKYGISFSPKELIKSRKKTGNKWFETQDAIAYMDDLSKQKIIWGELSDLPKFAFDTEGRYTPLNTAFLMTGQSLGYIIAFLNSPVSKYYFSSNIATSSGVGTIRWLKYTIETLPIPLVADETMEEIECLVVNLETENHADEKLAAIDRRIYNLYGFTDEEVAFVEHAYVL